MRLMLQSFFVVENHGGNGPVFRFRSDDAGVQQDIYPGCLHQAMDDADQCLVLVGDHLQFQVFSPAQVDGLDTGSPVFCVQTVQHLF